jgi:putative acetyltransferase
MYSIIQANETHYHEIVEVWEASVRATHSFVTEDDIRHFRPLILNEYLKMVNLWYVKSDQNRIAGFLGVSGDNIEMLFVHPDVFGKGLGKMLVEFAKNTLHTTRVDVNEQNPKAVRFYERAGFKVIGRSELDPTGRPYPILHMELTT